jgi:hypothetical protein
MSTAPLIKGGPSVARGLVECRLCTQGFRRVDGLHVPSQRLGMIPSTPCDRVFATRGREASDKRPWLAYVDGDVVRKKGGDPRRFSSAKSAYAAACKEAPRRWHP